MKVTLYAYEAYPCLDIEVDSAFFREHEFAVDVPERLIARFEKAKVERSDAEDAIIDYVAANAPDKLPMAFHAARGRHE
jgi:hypothetical protein